MIAAGDRQVAFCHFGAADATFNRRHHLGERQHQTGGVQRCLGGRDFASC